jgi:hypothetical protein
MINKLQNSYGEERNIGGIGIFFFFEETMPRNKHTIFMSGQNWMKLAQVNLKPK